MPDKIDMNKTDSDMSAAGPGARPAEITIGLSAVIIAVDETEAWFLGALRGNAISLPFGPFDPAGHRTFELGLRDWVRAQTGFEPGYVEQLYTFGDQGREMPGPDPGEGAGMGRVISIGYLGLAPARTLLSSDNADWRPWRNHFPWEDWRSGRPACLDRTIIPALRQWAARVPARESRNLTRMRAAFGLDGLPWIEERALERYELIYESRLAPEAIRDLSRFGEEIPCDHDSPDLLPARDFGVPMESDHRRILATAIGRLRAKIKYRPVIFELMPEQFTLSGLQKVVEAVAGLPLHKQNFRRLLERSGLVEGAGIFHAATGGRPAELFRFRREALAERQAFGLHVPTPRVE